MGDMARTAARHSTIVLGLALACLALSSGAARAGTYEVVACDAAPGGNYGSWLPRATDKMGTGQHCPSAGRESGGLWAGNAVNVGTIPAFAASQYYFDAPPGTSIVFFAARYMFRRFDPYWRLGVFADTHMLHGCEPAAQETGCFFNSQSIDGDSTWGWTPNQIHQVSIVTACGSGTGCRSDAAAPNGDRAGVRLYGASVRIHDDSVPEVWATGAGIYTGAWHRGTQSAAYSATDNVGFRRTRLYVDGTLLREDERECDFAQRRPCGDVPSGSYDVNTLAVPDGDHIVRVEGVDAAGNVGGFNHAFRSDNTAPGAPRDLAVEGGEGWRQANLFKVSWRNPGSASPIRVARYRLCNAATNECTTGSRQGDGISSISNLEVPALGHYRLRVWLEDQAGNVNDANWSDEVSLRFDNVPPGEAEPAARSGWLSAAQSAGYVQTIRMRAGAFHPVSGIAGYSVTVDGSDPDGTVDSVDGTYRIPELPEGTTTVKARAVSGAGVPSGLVGSTLLRVDRSSPTVGVVNPPTGEWHRGPVGVSAVATDQAHLSGMAAAPAELPVEAGGFVEFRLDGGDRRTVRGPHASVTFEEDGEHSVTFAAHDVAGNRSPERAVSFRIDRTPPELVVFEAPDQADPRRVVVAASDRTSGVASATIEMRRVTHDGDRWIEMPATRDGDRFVATVDDESFERGVYQLRARVVDRAGNESAGDRRRDGSPATIDTESLRHDSRLTAALVTPPSKATKKVCPKKRPGRKRKCRKKTTTTPGGAPVAALALPLGKGAVARGVLEADSGAPLGDAPVDVYTRSSAAGAEFERVDTVKTDLKGAFSYAVPAGSSRAIRFRFEGDTRHRSTEEAVTIRVPAGATTVASHRTRRNGQTVRFKGKLQSRPVPAGGKVLDLQAFYRGKWRTFATPRANAKGKWGYGYRFGATRGTVPYRFRVLIRPESAYPYDLGYSNTVKVVVRGR
jgi:hypothetical protein